MKIHNNARSKLLIKHRCLCIETTISEYTRPIGATKFFTIFQTKQIIKINIMAQAVLKFAKSVYPWKICCSPDCFPNKPIFPEMLITRKTATTDFLICLNDQPK